MVRNSKGGAVMEKVHPVSQHQKKFFGSWTALVTPFRHGQVDEESFARLIEWQIACGTTGLVILGTTGESPIVSFEEHTRIIEFAVRVVNGRVPVIAGTGANSTSEAEMLTQQAQKVGADACLSVVPYYNKPSQEGLYRHFRSIAENTSLPIILYDVPGRTVVSLEIATVLRLAEIPNIVGIKAATTDARKGCDLLRILGNDFLVFSGDDSANFSFMMLGAIGSISVTSNIVPSQMAEFWREGRAGNWQRAREIHFALESLNAVLFLETNPIMVKAAAHLMGLIDLEYRLPLCEPSEANMQKLKAVLASSGLI
jgi:4-hydroxy-tetrahydrodipicolinate synthase